MEIYTHPKYNAWLNMKTKGQFNIGRNNFPFLMPTVWRVFYVYFFAEKQTAVNILKQTREFMTS